MATDYICRQMKVLFRFVLMISLILLQGYFYLRPDTDRCQHHRIRIILPRGVDQFTAFTNNYEQKATVQQHHPQAASTPRDAEALVEVEEEEEDETDKKQQHDLPHHGAASDYFSASLIVTSTHTHWPQEPSPASPPGNKYIFHCVFRI